MIRFDAATIDFVPIPPVKSSTTLPPEKRNESDEDRKTTMAAPIALASALLHLPFAFRL